MAEIGRRKQLAKVLVSHDIDGSLEIKEIILNKPDGGEESFSVQKSKDPYWEKQKPTGAPHKYPITVNGQDTFIYEDGGQWWVQRKD